MENKEGKTQDTERPIVVDNYLRAALLFILVIALGLLALNQGLGFFYKAHFLKQPCDLCAELNPEVQECIDYLNSPRPSFWVGGEGNQWSDPFQDGNNLSINISYLP